MSGNPQMPAFQKPSPAEAFFNRALGFLVGLGIGPNYMRLLQAPGRKSGRMQWVRNAEAAGEITLKRGSARNTYRLRALPDGEKPEILKLYLEKYKSQVQRYFPVLAGSPAETFRDIAANYPVFELIPA